MDDLYSLLEASQNDSLDSLRKRAREKRRRWVRAAGAAPSVEARRRAEDCLAALESLEYALVSEESKRRYDAELKRSPSPSSSETPNSRKEPEIIEEEEEQTVQYHTNPEFNPKMEIERAWSLFQRGLVSAAAEKAYTVRSFSPSDRRILIITSVGWLENGNLDAALLAASDGVSLYPNDPALNYILGRIYVRLNKWDRAEPYFQKAHSREPGKFDYALMLSIALRRLERPFDAASVLLPFAEKKRPLDPKELDTAKHHFATACFHCASITGVSVKNHQFLSDGIYIMSQKHVDDAKAWIQKGIAVYPNEKKEGMKHLKNIEAFEESFFIGNKSLSICSGVWGAMSFACPFIPSLQKLIHPLLLRYSIGIALYFFISSWLYHVANKVKKREIFAFLYKKENPSLVKKVPVPMLSALIIPVFIIAGYAKKVAMKRIAENTRR